MLAKAIAGIGVGVLTTALLAGACPADAAVRVCRQPVTSGLATDKTQARAQKRAIADWTNKSKAAGVSNPSWRIAAGKVLKCVQPKIGTYQCIAYAAPCTVSQVPAKRKRGGGPELET